MSKWAFAAIAAGDEQFLGKFAVKNSFMKIGDRRKIREKVYFFIFANL